VPVLGYDDAAAAWHASERLIASGQTPSFVDGQIAAIARVKVNALVLVTAQRHYQEFEGLMIEDWRAP